MLLYQASVGWCIALPILDPVGSKAGRLVSVLGLLVQRLLSELSGHNNVLFDVDVSKHASRLHLSFLQSCQEILGGVFYFSSDRNMPLDEKGLPILPGSPLQTQMKVNREYGQ